ncbi:TetR/AcrR family transcriptional regulator [Streptomyces tauricus]|uniref:TetR/AcrR family transcriptional regulator n=1 Tax=Streptomyces tauricus TaxID=68274 RepID=A0ABZ1JTE5_9ACTN|nr:helix-turn-helix domain-containing protein [Streptomyces tauricus]
MARWDPGTEGRLVQAALELFAECGYDDVTVTHIAERAGITRRSYFRYFPDKREALFAGSDRLPPALAEAVLAADESAAPLPAVLDAFAEVGSRLVEVIDHAAERRAVIRASPELQERERTKLVALTVAAHDALRERGVDDDHAKLVAQIATITFQNAFERWLDGHGDQDFAFCLQAVTGSLRRVLSA